MPSSSHAPQHQKRLPALSRRLKGILISALVLVTLVVARETIPFEIRIPESLLSDHPVDPAKPLIIRGVGLGTRLSGVRLKEAEGTVVAEIPEGTASLPGGTLEFGKSYILTIDAERAWLHQAKHQKITFRTPNLPQFESLLEQQLNADGTIRLAFSEPVGNISPKGDLQLTVQREADDRHFILKTQNASYEQGRHYPVAIRWETPEGIPLPEFEVDVLTAPPLNADIDLRGMKNLGLAMPVEITFSEPVQDREKAASSVTIVTEQGEILPGKPLWFGRQRLQYRPQTLWPAHQTLEVRLKPGPARSAQGGFLAEPVSARFSTGSDRRIEVWLDRQRVEIFENGELIKTLKASTGKSKTPTVTGSFYIYARFPKKTMKSTGLKPGEKGYYEVKDVPYAQYFHEGYAFHGAFWHNAFGQPASHGCINLATQEKNSRQGVNEDAGWLFQWASLGVPVTVHETSPPKAIPASAEKTSP